MSARYTELGSDLRDVSASCEILLIYCNSFQVVRLEKCETIFSERPV